MERVIDPDKAIPWDRIHRGFTEGYERGYVLGWLWAAYEYRGERYVPLSSKSPDCPDLADTLTLDGTH